MACNRCIDELRKHRPLFFSELEMEESEDGLSFLSAIPDPYPLPEEVAEQHDLVRSSSKQLRPSHRNFARLFRYAIRTT